MNRPSMTGMLCGLWLLSGTFVATLAEDQPQEQAKALREKAARIERTIKEQSRELKELLATAERIERGAPGQKEKPGHSAEHHGQNIHERLRELVQQEQKLVASKGSEDELRNVREQIGGLKQKLGRHPAQHPGPFGFRPEMREHMGKLEAASRKLHHMRVAAENLKQAELHDVARQLAEKADLLEKEIQTARQKLGHSMREAHAHHQHPDQILGAVRELRSEVERLRRDQRLSQKVDKDRR